MLDRFERDQAFVLAHKLSLICHHPLDEGVVFFNIPHRYRQDEVSVASDVPTGLDFRRLDEPTLESFEIVAILILYFDFDQNSEVPTDGSRTDDGDDPVDHALAFKLADTPLDCRRRKIDGLRDGFRGLVSIVLQNRQNFSIFLIQACFPPKI